MYGEAGEFFFHYTTADTAFRHIVADGGRLRLSPYSQMRDPVEAEDWTFVGTYVGDELPNDEALSRHFAFHEYARRAKATTKLLSLTVDADGYEDSLADFARGYARATMWELYADRHAGVCLVFDRPKLADVLDEQLSGQGTCFHGPVRYEQGGIALHHRGIHLESLTDDMSADVARHVTEHHDALLFTKVADWDHEVEYRFVVVTEDEDYLFCDYGATLHAVILGREFPEWQLAGARALCEARDVDLLKMGWNGGRPQPIHRWHRERSS